jgi:oligopeptide transport system ATP-binding protein
MTVREIIGEGLIIQGKTSKADIEAKVAEVLKIVGLSPEYASRYPHEFSGGQRQRIGVARAVIMDPNVIIADEPISALDVSIRAQVINLLFNLRETLGLTILFIAHDLSVVRFFCDRIAVMYNGKVVESAPSEELFNNPKHPYTISLLSAIPQPDPDYEKNRQRIHYDPRVHRYDSKDIPSLKEISANHFVYANNAEFALMKSTNPKEENANKKEGK